MKDVITIFERTTSEEVWALDKDLPSDTHLIEYIEDNTLLVDAVRAFSKVHVFDFYHDKLSEKASKEEISTFSIVSITNGLGLINPRLWTGLSKDSDS
tara:strand:+ start:108 stop:401 length:294 start_codon:yes stop_codon:yes gene_type:complete